MISTSTMLAHLLLMLPLDPLATAFSPSVASSASTRTRRRWGQRSGNNHYKAPALVSTSSSKTALLYSSSAIQNATDHHVSSTSSSSVASVIGNPTTVAFDITMFEQLAQETLTPVPPPSGAPEVRVMQDPANVEFAPCLPEDDTDAAAALQQQQQQLPAGAHSCAAMMQACGPFIAAHAGQTAVFHIPGELIEQLDSSNSNDKKRANDLISDIALAWLLGLKIVLVLGCRFDTKSCSLLYDEDPSTMCHAHENHNTLRVTDAESLRHAEEEAGYLRTEIERKLNRCLRMHGGIGDASDENAAPQGNVVSGNSFYAAQRFGKIRGKDFEHTGYTGTVHAENIEHVLNNNDVVLLTTVGLSPMGDVVNVNGYHLAATVAASLDAYKLIYMANHGSVLQHKQSTPQQQQQQGATSTTTAAAGCKQQIQELPLSFAQAITDLHRVRVHNTGFATFEHARKTLEPHAVEMLLHLAWSSWALDRGVRRAHVVNRGNGALLEELFTSMNGANTCLHHDDESEEPADDLAQEDWDEFFAAAQAQQQEEPQLSYA